MAQNRKALELVIKTAQIIIGTHLQSISDITEVRYLHRAQKIVRDNTHPSYSLFTLLPSRKTTEVSTAIPPDYGTASFPGWETPELILSTQ